MGEILIDKNTLSFSLTGSVIRDQQPLEYLAVKKGGHKEYESLLEMNTTASEFNLACILIGLDAKNAVLPEYHFDERPVKGDPVDVIVEWGEGEAIKRVRAESLFLIDGKPVKSSEWVYTGSVILPNKQYLAEEAGTLIGFIHDQDSIIEHREGIGLGQYGKVEIDKSTLPPIGKPIRIIVQNSKPK